MDRPTDVKSDIEWWMAYLKIVTQKNPTISKKIVLNETCFFLNYAPEYPL